MNNNLREPSQSTEAPPANPDDDEKLLADSLRYARGLIRKAATSGASFVDINVSTLAYLVENRRKLNDRLRWAEQRAVAVSAPVVPPAHKEQEEC